MAKDKSTLFGARDLAQRISEMLDYAAEAEGKHEERVAARAEHETLVSRNKELKAENAALQLQNDTLKQEYAEFATVDAKTKHLRDLDKQIAERTGQLRSANRDLEALRQQFAGV